MDFGTTSDEAVGRIIELGEIVPHCAARSLRIDVVEAPFAAGYRAALVGVDRDRARIDGNAFATDLTGREAARNDALGHAAERGQRESFFKLMRA